MFELPTLQLSVKARSGLGQWTGEAIATALEQTGATTRIHVENTKGSCDNVRKLASRARRHVKERRPRFQTTREQRDQLAQRFFAAAEGIFELDG